MRTSRFLATALFASVCVPSAALALPSVADKTTATQLFDDAEKLLAAGNVNDACPKYAESERLDPQLGTLLHLANCYEKAGKTASAWASFKEAVEIAAKRGDSREATARARAAAIEPTLCKLVITVDAAAPSDIEVRQDGEIVRRAVWGSEVPLDPGNHAVTATAAGFKPFEAKRFVHEAGKTARVHVPVLEQSTGAAAPPAPMTSAAAPGAGSAAPPSLASPGGSAPSRSGSGQRVAGLIVAGGGLAVIGVGLGIGAAAKSQYSDANCPNNVCATADDGAARDSAQSKATIATVIFGVGAAALVGGGVMWLTASSKADPSTSAMSSEVRVGITPRGILLRGAF